MTVEQKPKEAEEVDSLAVPATAVTAERTAEGLEKEGEVKEVEQEQEQEVQFRLALRLPNFAIVDGKEEGEVVGVEGEEGRQKKSLIIIVTQGTLVQEIKQHFYESPMNNFLTCFFLEFKGKRINEMLELHQIEGLSQQVQETGEVEMSIVQDIYSEHQIRVHINRLREILTNHQASAASNASNGGGLGGLGVSGAGGTSGGGFTMAARVAGESLLADVVVFADSRKKKEEEDKQAEKEKAGTVAAIENGESASAEAKSETVLPAVAFTEEEKLNVIEGFKNFKALNPTLFSTHFPHVSIDKGATSCLKSFGLSAWSPVPSYRRMQGDLLYLSLTTLEGDSFEITASATGFFVNGSTNDIFSPQPKLLESGKTSTVYPIIIDQLESLSPLFKSNFKLLNESISAKHPFEYISASFPSLAWKVEDGGNDKKYRSDAGRVLDAFFVTREASETLQSRDWNDDMQNALEMGTEFNQAENLEGVNGRLKRDQAVVRSYQDFIEASMRAVACVIDGSITPIHVADPSDLDADSQNSARMFIHNNIFLSMGYDNKDTFDQYGGAEAAHVAVSKDIDGIRDVAARNIKGVHTLGTVLIDYKGHRILAQSIVPGILRKLEGQENTIQYGSVDGGITIKTEDSFKETAERLGRALHLKPHTLLDGNGDAHVLATSVETKWVKGTDDRQYVLDLYRVSPVDARFLELVESEKEENPYPHKMVLLRREIVDLYYDFKVREAIKDYQEKVQADKERLKEEGKPIPSDEEISANFNFSIALNPDVFTSVKFEGSPEELEADQALVRDISAFISIVISEMVLDFVKTPSGIPLDSAGLTRAMHIRGINMRYLGEVANTIEKIPEFRIDSFKSLLREEMITRAAKRILRELLEPLALHQSGACIAHFFNCYFGANVPALRSSEERGYESLTSEILHSKIVSSVKSRFRNNLIGEFWTERQYTTLRSICLKVGIQITASKSYKFGGETPFSSEDILNIYPIIKHASPRASLAIEAMEHGKMTIGQGQVENGLLIAREAVGIYEQVFGPVHSETGNAYALLATFNHNQHLNKQAVTWQRRAVIISERCNGFDDAETIQQYLNLGFFEFSVGNTVQGLKYMKYALEQQLLLAGDERHPVTNPVLSNIAVMLHTLEANDLAVSFYEKALDLCKELYGPNHGTSIQIYDLLTKSHYEMGDYKKALTCQQFVFKFYKNALGEEHERTKSCIMLLKHLTALAVDLAKKTQKKKTLGKGDDIFSHLLKSNAFGNFGKSSETLAPAAATL